jgi:polysaccharide biosynthesis protein PelE
MILWSWLRAHALAVRTVPAPALLAIGGLLELLAAIPVARQGGGALLSSLPAHTLATLAIALGLERLLPEDFLVGALPSFVLFFSLNWFIPILGAVGVAAAVLMPLRGPPRLKESSPFSILEIPPLPFRPSILTSDPLYGGIGLIGVIRHADSMDLRVRAVMATRKMNDQYAIPILQVALRDSADDVRLLAYAFLDRKERTLYARTKEGTAKLATVPADQQGPIHRGIAQSYWELARLGLAQGQVLQHVLDTAVMHIRSALSLGGEADAELWYLLGRVNLRKGNFQEATNAFNRCRPLGMRHSTIVPFQAEIAFRTRSFHEVKWILEQLDPIERERRPLNVVFNYWQS